MLKMNYSDLRPVQRSSPVVPVRSFESLPPSVQREIKRSAGVKALDLRLSNLEAKISSPEPPGPSGPSGPSEPKQMTFIEKLNHQRALRTREGMEQFEDKYFQEITHTFDLTDKKMFPKIVAFTVTYIQENAVLLAKIVGYALAGSARYDLVMTLLKKLFCDISEDLLGSIIQHTYDIKYTKDVDTKTLMILEKKIEEVNLGNVLQKNGIHQAQSDPKKNVKGGRRHFGCFR